MNRLCCFALTLSALWINNIQAQGVEASATGAATSSQPVAIKSESQFVYRTIPLKSVKPSVMAWWLDPAHHSKPPRFGFRINRRDIDVEKHVDLARIRKMKGFTPLPENIKAIVSVDPQKCLLVRGTEDAIAKLRQTIGLLDEPLQQITFRVRILKISDEYLYLFTRQKHTRAVQEGVYYLSEADTQRMEEFIVQKKASLMQNLRVTAIDTLPEQLRSTLPIAAKIGIENTNGEVQTLLDTSQRQNPYGLSLSHTLDFIFTPIINPMKNIMVDVVLVCSVVLEQEADSQEERQWQQIILEPVRKNKFDFKFQPGETILLTGITDTRLSPDRFIERWDCFSADKKFIDRTDVVALISAQPVERIATPA